MARKIEKTELQLREERQHARIDKWRDQWAATYVETYVSCSNLLLDRLGLDGLEAVRIIHGELCRRFPTRIGTPGFLALDRRLHDMLEQGHQPQQRKPDPCTTPDLSPPSDAGSEPSEPLEM